MGQYDHQRRGRKAGAAYGRQGRPLRPGESARLVRRGGRLVVDKVWTIVTFNRRQKIWLSIVILVNLAFWLIPSDVVEQIARDRHTLLGRYSREHFTVNLVVLLISFVSLYVDWCAGKTYKRRWFRVIAVILAGLPLLGILDFFLRGPETTHYVRDHVAYHRPASAVFHRTFEDKPQAYRTYPNAPPGYGTIPCVLHTDRRGFRNQTDFETYDVVVLGDSFAEGSNVSDGDVWPVSLAARSGLTVYNLGMSGYEPLEYLDSLRRYGLPLRPQYVLCMLYEGNDFRSAKADRKRENPSVSDGLRRYFKQSPLLGAVDRLLIDTFGPIRSDGPVRGSEVLDWLPLAIPEGVRAKHYAFDPTQLRDLYQNPKDFAVDRHWLNSRAQLAEMNALCVQAGCRLIVVYAPTVAHVALPLVADWLAPQKVRAFTAIRYKRALPDVNTFWTNLRNWTDTRERVVGEWCGRESIPFLSLTPALAEAMIDGTQVYYTYDQHWTPEGHRVVAEAVDRFLAHGMPPQDAATPQP